MRAGLLASRRVGRAGARALAERGSLAEALHDLSSSPYGREMAAARTLEDAQRAVAATLLWHLRVLAGWLPPAGTERLRALAAWFEIANVQDRLAYLVGEPQPGAPTSWGPRGRRPFELGGLATAWPALARAGSPEAMRAVLARSRWRDPGSPEPAAIAAAMRAAWAGRVATAVPEAAGWARAAAALLLARQAPGDGAAAALGRVAGLGAGRPRPARAAAPADLAALLPEDVRWALAGVDGPEGLWLAEARWWSRVESDAAHLTAGRRLGPATVVGVVGLLAADAWRVRAALAAAASGPAGREAFDAVA